MPPPQFYIQWIIAMVGVLIGGIGTGLIFQGYLILGLVVGAIGLLIFNKALRRS
ncbi:MAG: hypothetical protein UV01_C0004G0050 [Parcubacteria group bacterium GW2011_GWA2_42_14]|nr:MAG: hypothetical protein UV01_C0004G0050 [Parcubacteria group bacterium GW2011_GWA2_42_14]